MNSTEIRASLTLSLIMGLRMLGLFMLLPVLAIHVRHMPGAHPLWVGLAVGGYGITQAILQIPMGWLSDRWGRRPVITMGLLFFLAGSLLAARASVIYLLVFGRLLQGSGAVASAMTAMLSDLVREEKRTLAMAVLGISIGLSFIVALVAGPALEPIMGVSGLFYIGAAGSIAAIALLWLGVPKPPQPKAVFSSSIRSDLFAVIKQRQLWPLDFGIFALHATLTANFMALPEVLTLLPQYGTEHTHFYLLMFGGSLFLMIPLLGMSSRGYQRQIYYASIMILALAQAALWFSSYHVSFLLASGMIFFAAFNVLEASLPALISSQAPAEHKGAAMGIYSTSQFGGAFFGAAFSGVLTWIIHSPATAGFAAALVMSLLWLLFEAKSIKQSFKGTSD